MMRDNNNDNNKVHVCIMQSAESLHALKPCYKAYQC